MATRKLAALGLVLLAVVIPGGCSPRPGPDGAEQVVFAVATGFRQWAPDRTIDVVDVGVPGLHNLTSHIVRLRKISLVSVPPAGRLLSVTAHTGAWVGILVGDLTNLCHS